MNMSSTDIAQHVLWFSCHFIRRKLLLDSSVEYTKFIISHFEYSTMLIIESGNKSVVSILVEFHGVPKSSILFVLGALLKAFLKQVLVYPLSRSLSLSW